MGAGNVLGQLIMMAKGKQKRFLLKKLAAFIVFGVFFSGPLGHWWLKFLNGHRIGLKCGPCTPD
jgi:F0F1-type ATP synthase assembly protein I